MTDELNVVVENGGAYWLLVFDPAGGVLTASQAIDIPALETFLQSDADALLASIPPETEGRPFPFSQLDWQLMWRDELGRMLVAACAVATGWDGTENTDGYGYWRQARYRFRILAVTGTGVVPVAVTDRFSILKEAFELKGQIFGSFDGLAHFLAQPAEANEHGLMVSLNPAGEVVAMPWTGDYFDSTALFRADDSLFCAVSSGGA